ncbi:MAG TPA: GNAT family N-acetyltransferase [Acidimicrobiales bacterium]|nr:GNAT family N-acetyltransferase [Acidimicrobiales bacterium]
MREPVYRRLGVDDAGQALTVQRAAFVDEARVYRTVEIPPLVESLDQLRHEIATTITMGAFVGERLVGSARLTLEGSVGWISRVAVAPDQQGAGIGSALLAAVEGAAPPEVTVFQLCAGGRSDANVAMYARRGYREFERRTDAAGVELICMRKARA